MNAGIFSVASDDVSRLDETGAVLYFRELLHAECMRQNLPLSNVNISEITKAPDGGIDATVLGVQGIVEGLIKEGSTYYQIKSVKNLRPWTISSAKEILFGKKKAATKDNLGIRIKTCLDSSGTFVLVSFQDDFVDKREETIEMFKGLFQSIGISDAKVDVLGICQIIGYTSYFPSLQLYLNGLGEFSGFIDHSSWSRNGDMQNELVMSEKIKGLIEEITRKLLENTEAIHINIQGEPGIGKTRIINEVTGGSEYLKSLTLYCSNPNSFLNSKLISRIRSVDSHFSVVLVVDECDPRNRNEIWNSLKTLGKNIRLITIYNEFEKSSYDFTVFEIPRLEDKEIVEIIQNSGVPLDRARRLADYCEGSPRVARVIAENAMHNPEDILRPIDSIWESYVKGYRGNANVDFNHASTILQTLSLFKKFGFGVRFAQEHDAILQLLKRADPSITDSVYAKIIAHYRNRKILQGENTLYITPRALHIYLWKSWWEVNNKTFIYDEFISNLPKSLQNWFYEMLRYADESDAAKQVVESLLSETGPFKDEAYLRTDSGSHFFLVLTEASPLSALNRLELQLGDNSNEELLSHKINRSNLVWSLERIAMWREGFHRAAKLLLSLGEAENQTYGNNASGVFADLFSLRAQVTEATPEERVNFLKEVSFDTNNEKQTLILNALEHAFELGGFTQVIGDGFHGIARSPQFWTFKTYGELFDALELFWDFAMEWIERSSENSLKQKIAVVLVKHSFNISKISSLRDKVFRSVEYLLKKKLVDERGLIEGLTSRIRFIEDDLKGTEFENYWKELLSSLVGTSYESLLKRYVGMSLLEDEYPTENKNATSGKIAELALYSLQHVDLFLDQLDWLLSSDAKNGYVFGYTLSQKDSKLELLDNIIEAHKKQQSKEVFFLSGYLRNVAEKNPELYLRKISKLTNEDYLSSIFVELVFRARLNDSSMVLLLNQVNLGKIKVDDFYVLRYGLAVQELSEKVFTVCLEELLRNGERGCVSTALHLFEDYYVHKEAKYKIPKDITMKLLLHPVLFGNPEKKYYEVDGYLWANIATRYLLNYPKAGKRMIKPIIGSFGNDYSLFDYHTDETIVVLGELCKLYPDNVWKEITLKLERRDSMHKYALRNWLRGGSSFGGVKETPAAIGLFPEETIWKWVEEKTKTRAVIIAEIVPKIMSKNSLSRELLVRFGKDINVRSRLHSNFISEGWTGPESLHLERLLSDLVAYKSSEDNKNVLIWLNEHIEYLRERISNAKVEEERDRWR